MLGIFQTQLLCFITSFMESALDAMCPPFCVSQPARFGHVLFCCWIAYSGAGLLRRDDVLVAAKRLRYSLDLQFEVESQERVMQEAVAKVRASSRQAPC